MTPFVPGQLQGHRESSGDAVGAPLPEPDHYRRSNALLLVTWYTIDPPVMIWRITKGRRLDDDWILLVVDYSDGAGYCS